MTLQDLGLFIRTERKRAGLSIGSLAQQAGIDRTLLSKLENQRLPELGYAKLERVLGVLGYNLMVQPAGGLPTLRDLQRENRSFA